MTKGPNRLVLDEYLSSATEGVVKNAGADWKSAADDLQVLAEALGRAAEQAELRIGEQTLTGPALRASMEKTSESMLHKSEQLRTAGEALRVVGVQIADTRDSRDSMADLGTKPAAYQPPAGTPGVEPTPEELKAQADASQARANERSAWQGQYDKQEAKALALTKEMDAAFLSAIPPMKAIHGQPDPTEPPPSQPSGPDGPYLPGTQAPPVTGGGGGGGNTPDSGAKYQDVKPSDLPDNGGRPQLWPHPPKPEPPVITEPPRPPVITEPPVTTEPPVHPTPTVHHPEAPSTSVGGTSQDGVAYQPSGSPTSVAGASGSGGASGAGAGAATAFGAAGGAGGMAAGMAGGAIRGGTVPTAPSGSAPARPIGASGRAGSTGSLSRPSASAGSASARTSGAGSAGTRGASTGSSAGRGSAGGRGAGSSGSRSGSPSGSRGTSGARGTGSAGGRNGRRTQDEQSAERDRLVYDQDWLGDDDVAPGVLD